MDFTLSPEEIAVLETARRIAADPDPFKELVLGGWFDQAVTDGPLAAMPYLGLVAEALGAAGVSVPLIGAALVWPACFRQSADGHVVGIAGAASNEEDLCGQLVEDGVGATRLVAFGTDGVRAYEEFEVEPVSDLPGDRLARLVWLGPPAVQAAAPAGGLVADCAAALVAAETAGVLQALTTLTVRHVNERSQFGRPLSHFQVVAERAARIATFAEAATWLARAACQSPEPERVAAAKGFGARAAVAASALGHQLHGAIGFTTEHRLGTLTSRLRTLRFAWGSDRHHHRALGGLRAGGCGPRHDQLVERLT